MENKQFKRRFGNIQNIHFDETSKHWLCSKHYLTAKKQNFNFLKTDITRQQAPIRF